MTDPKNDPKKSRPEKSRPEKSRGWIDYDYAVVRLVPQVHLEQFINIGVVLHARTQEVLLARIEPDWRRAEAICSEIDRREVTRQVEGMLRIAAGDADAGPIALLPPSERFHWLTAPRSAVLQTSSVKTARTRDLEQALEALFVEQCGRGCSSRESD